MAGGEVELTFDPCTRVALAREPVTVGVPFAPGLLPSPAEACLFDGAEELYVQRQTLSTWPDGSIRWLLLDFQVDLPANAAKTLRLRYGQGATGAVLTETGVSLVEERQQLVLDNGPLRIVCRTRPFRLFDSLALDGAEVIAPHESLGFRVVDLAGTVYRTAACRDAAVSVEAAGPVRAAVRVDGSHVDDNKHAFLDFSLLVTTWSDCPYAAVDYQFIHRRGSEVVELHEVSYAASFAASEGATLRAAAPAGGQVVRDAGLALAELPREPSRQRLAGRGRRGLWVDRCRAGHGLAVGVRQAGQQFPKRLVVDNNVLQVDLYPSGDQPLRLPQGAAKSHELLFLAHHGQPDGEALARRFRLFDRPPRPRLPASWYHDAAALGAQYPRRSYFRLDALLDEAFDSRPRALGMLHFGDEPHPRRVAESGAPDAIVWSNNAGDLAHALFLHYVRTGLARHVRAAQDIVRHVLDLDYVHFSSDPLRDGGLAAPDVEHCLHARVAPAHQWVEGLVDHHYLTGCCRSLQALRRIGQNLLRHVPALLAQPLDQFDPLAMSQALDTTTILYRELGKPHHFEAARKLLDRLAEASAAGHGLVGRGPAEADHSPLSAAAAVLTAIARFHLLSDEQRAADLFLRELDALIAPGPNILWRQADDGPCVANAVLLEALAYAHRLSGEAGYLDVGRPQVRRLLRGPLLALRLGPRELDVLGDALVRRPVYVPAPGPTLARVVRALLAYLAEAEAADRLAQLGLRHSPSRAATPQNGRCSKTRGRAD